MAKILLAEDDNDIRMAYAFALSKAGHQVVEAKNGAEAVAELESEHPDLVVLDMLMPGLSGLDFLRQSQIASRYPKVKVIAFSNIESPRVIEEARRLGIADYILKVDTTPRQIVELVTRHLGSP